MSVRPSGEWPRGAKEGHAMTVKKDDRVYRVESTCLDPPNPQFLVKWRRVVQASSAQIRLAAPFSDVSGVVFRKSNNGPGLNISFFTTPEAAVEAFKRKALRAKTTAERQIKHAETEVTWADQWLASSDKPIAAQRRKAV
jgi:hypothetical protein